MPYKEKPIEKKYYRFKEVQIDTGLNFQTIRNRCKRLGINHLQIPVDKVSKIVNYDIKGNKKYSRSIRVYFTDRQIEKLESYSLIRGISIQEAIRQKCFR